MAHLDHTYHYRVYDGEEVPLCLINEDTALQYAVECTAKKVTFYFVVTEHETDCSEALALKWLKEQPEVPPILPKFINEHKSEAFNIMLELKRNQQLKGMR